MMHIIFASRWMETVLFRSVHHLKTIVKSVDDTEQHLKFKMKHVHEKLQSLRLKSEEVLNDQKAHIDTSVKEICQLFQDVLKQPATYFRLVHWLQQDLTSITKDDMWPDVQKTLHETLLIRITEEFTKWEEDTKKCQAVEREIFNEIKAELHILQSDLVSIEGELHSDSDSVSSDEYDLTARRKSSLLQIKIGRCGDYDFDVLHAAPLPVKLVSRFLHPFDTLSNKLRHSRIYEAYEMAKWNKKMEKFMNDPLNVAKNVSEKFLHRFLQPEKGDESQLLKFVSEIMERPRELLEVIEKSIPAMIKANEELLDHISFCRINTTESRESYEQMMEGMETLKHHLMEYGTGHIYVDDFMGREIRLRDDFNEYADSGEFRCSDIILRCSNSSQNDRRIPRGIWTALQSASLYDESEKGDEAILIKVYLPLSGISETFAEVTKLR